MQNERHRTISKRRNRSLLAESSLVAFLAAHDHDAYHHLPCLFSSVYLGELIEKSACFLSRRCGDGLPLLLCLTLKGEKMRGGSHRILVLSI